MGATAALEPRVVPVEPGGEAALDVTIRNTGSVVDQFTIEVLGEVGAWATSDPPTISLFPGAAGSARITVRPPRLPTTAAGTVPFGVRVQSAEDPPGSTVEEATLEVAAFIAPAGELIPRTSHGSRTGRHDVAIDNRGNVPLRAALDGVDPDRLVRFDFDPPGLDVEPGVAGFAKVRVKPVRTFWRGGARTRPFRVAIQPDAAGAEALVLDGSYLQESILPPWFVRALLAALALLVAAILLWLLVLRPEIRSSAAETLVDFGFSPKPGSHAAGGGGGGGGGASPSPAPSGAVTITPPPDGGQGPVDGRLDTTTNALTPTAGTLFITDLVFSNPTGATGDVTLQRTTPTGTSPLFVLRLDNFRDLDFHFVTPIVVHAGETLALVPSCTAPVGPTTGVPACVPAVFYSGYVAEE